MPEAGCAICGDAGASVVLPACPATDTDDTFRIVRCAGCGTLRTDPVPADLGPYYATDLARTMTHAGSGLFARLRRVQLGREWRRVRAVVDPGVVLDLGCGVGDFARRIADAGDRVVAADASATPPAMLARPPVVPYRRFDFDTLAFSPPLDVPPDTVVLRHVLEHVRAPTTLLRTLADLGVRTVYIVVPNASSRERRLLGVDWYLWDPPRHVWHFDAETLAGVLARAGYAVATSGRDTAPTLVPSVYRWLRRRGAPAVAYRPFGPTGLLSALGAPLNLLTAGNVIWAVAHAPSAPF